MENPNHVGNLRLTTCIGIVASMALMFGATGSVVAAEHGVSDSEVKIGMSNAQTGNAAALGQGVKAGASAYFDKVNAAGGINGRKITLIAYDDGYEPARCSGNTRRLLERDDVFALFGYVGTPTSAVVLPILATSDAPYFAPFTGAGTLRSPVKKNVFNIRAGYLDEAEALVQHLTTDLKVTSVGLFIQDDAYGAAGEKVVTQALKERGLSVAAKGTYTRNTVDVDAAVTALSSANPGAVIMVGAYKACAAFVHKYKAAGFKTQFCNISFVGTQAFIHEAGADSEGVTISQVMPSPFDASIPIVKQYQADMKAAGKSDFDYTSLEGYVDAVVFAHALDKAGKDLTRAAFTTAVEADNEDLGGFHIALSAADHQASKQVYLTVVQGGQPVPVKSQGGSLGATAGAN